MTDGKRPWVPTYRVDDLQYEVPSVSINECPVSYITAESLALVELETQARTIQQAAGAAFGGPDSAEWPAWWADVVTVAARCRAAEEYERDKALEYRRRNAR